ncbi:MgtC/SapB family protein [Piscinibacter defluvii]|uniref:MgtC/SapB family protein n=1 Tax=Piscinibacter defluvii TaxID=1796922 RepID=UPI002873A413|nr:DUF4010 domain-containing protein [Piscinibacter defluvii]
MGCGLLIGLERERRKGRGANRAAAGIRSFAIIALLGALAQVNGNTALVVAGAAGIVVLAALAYWRSPARDPGLTTELAMVATYLIGVQCVLWPALGAACGVVLVVLLAARTQLHRFATRWLSEQELHDGLMLAALALVVLPLVPDSAPAWLAGIRLRPLVALVLLILIVQAAGHLALRLLGPGLGVAAAGFFGGFVSSSATIAAYGARARQAPAQAASAAAAAAFSTCATWLQVLVMAVALAPAVVAELLPVAGAGALAAGAAAFALLRAAQRQPRAADTTLREHGVLRLREALLIAAALSLVTLLVAAAEQHFGSAGVYGGAVLAGLAEAHAPVAAQLALEAAGRIDAQTLRTGTLLAIGANSLTRSGVALLAGGAGFAARVSAALAAGVLGGAAGLAL